MLKPEPLKAFDMMYRRLTADGRGETLFGGRGERLRSAYEQTLIGDECPVVYLEIPLSGKPYCDMTALLSSIPADAAFAPGRGYGLERVFRWWRSRPEPVGCCGVEVDVKGDGPLRAAAILQHDGKRDQIEPFLHTLGAGDRLADYFAFCERLPGDWSDVYVGVFTGRPRASVGAASPGRIHVLRRGDGPSVRVLFRAGGSDGAAVRSSPRWARGRCAGRDSVFHRFGRDAARVLYADGSGRRVHGGAGSRRPDRRALAAASGLLFCQGAADS